MAGRADSTVLAGARVVLPTGTVENGRVIVEGTRIAGSTPDGARTVALPGHFHCLKATVLGSYPI